MSRLRDWARRLKRETLALYLAARDPRTPWYARVFTALVVAYALSPIDLIPDFVPVLGLLDDVILVPLGLALARHMVPAAVLADARQRAAELTDAGTRGRTAVAVIIVAIWIGAATLCSFVVYRALS